jgi:hypothetical protein
LEDGGLSALFYVGALSRRYRIDNSVEDWFIGTAD